MPSLNGLQTHVYTDLFKLLILGWVAQKPVNGNPQFKLTKVFLFSGIKMFFTAHVLCGLALFTLKTKGQTIWTENLPEKFQNWNQNSG